MVVPYFATHSQSGKADVVRGLAHLERHGYNTTEWISGAVWKVLRQLGRDQMVESKSTAAAKLMEKHYAGLFTFLAVIVFAVLAMLAWFGLRIRGIQQVGERRRRSHERTTPVYEAQAASGAAEALVVEGRLSETDAKGLSSILLTPFNSLLVVTPIGWASAWLGWGKTVTFVLNLIAILPQAMLIGDATEEMMAALRCGPVIGGFINATFGNTVEFVIMVIALIHGEVILVKDSLLGSILLNELLVLGAALLCGGLLESGNVWQAATSKEQNFSTASARLLAQVALFSSFCLAMPALLGLGVVDTEENTLLFSRVGSAVLLLGYTGLMLFQLGSHIEMMRGDGDSAQDHAKITSVEACVLLLTSCIVSAFTAHYMVHAIEGFVKETGISKSFVGKILLPLAGNACEHAVAVAVAMKDKLDLAIGISVGSAIQIALFATPGMVLVGWALDKPMDLDFLPNNALCLIFAAMLVMGTLSADRTNWLHGFMLVAAYALLMILFYFSPVEVAIDAR